ncbi:cobalt-precorrin-6A reductase [soil metagenome]
MLLLAGTAEANELARMLHDEPAVDVVASLAGRTDTPAPLPCPVRRGGFGGVEGLVRELRHHPYDVLVDATHPFATVMAHHAAEAASVLDIPRLRVLRESWGREPGDHWMEVDDLPAAARLLSERAVRRVFLSTGRLELAPFASLDDVEFVVRSIERPEPLPVARATVVLARPPFDLDSEVALLREHRIDTLVTKNSGGTATAAKLAAARACGVEVVMVRRPPQPPGPCVATATEAAAWVRSVTASG